MNLPVDDPVLPPASGAAVPTCSGTIDLAGEWGVIEARGLDATHFLHGQLTQDLALQGPGEARLAALCSAKGRMLASFVVVKLAPDHVLLVVRDELLGATVKRLSMFVLRAQVKLRDARDTWQVVGALGAAVAASPVADRAAWLRADLGANPADGIWVRLPDGGPDARALFLIGHGRSHAPMAGSDARVADWQWAEVASGIAPVTTATADAFVPQMLNYESVGGVNFKKGCYPGQEVVARSQFRGAIKRRACLVESPVALRVGQAVVDARDPEAEVGLVAWAADAALGIARHRAIVCVLTAARDADALAVRADESGQLHALALHALPYALRDDL